MKDRALLLAIDTCGPDDSIALGQQLFGKFHTLGNTQLGGRHTSEALVGHALDLLTMAGVYRTWLSAIVAVNGPGSLSRIRDGLNAVADLARDYQTPVAIVSRLEVLAAASGIPCIALDAGRQEIFLRLAGPSGEPRELLAGAAELASIPPPSRVAFCDKNSAQLLKLAWPATELVKVNGPAAADALMFAVARVDAGEFVDPASLEGHHLCRSDAEAEIRRMAAVDVDQVLAIAQGLPQAPHWPAEAYLQAIDAECTPRRIAIVAAGPQPGSLLGFAVARLLPPQAELETIAVATQGQRQGFGRMILHALAAELKASGVQELLLEVRAANQPAQSFYQALGFFQTGLRPGYYADPIEDAVLMCLPLG